MLRVHFFGRVVAVFGVGPFYFSCRPSHKPTKRIIRVVCAIPVFAQTVTYHVKGRTVRKVMGGGGGIFEPHEFFFVIKFLV